MKDTKALSWLSCITQKGTYKEDKYAEDAEKVVGLLPRPRLICASASTTRK